MSEARLKFCVSSYGLWGSDDDEVIKTDLSHNENNNYYYYVVSNFEIVVEAKENFFQVKVEDEIEVAPKTTLNPKLIQAMKKLQAS